MKKKIFLAAFISVITIFSACGTDSTTVQRVETPVANQQSSDDTPNNDSISEPEQLDEASGNVATVGETLERGGIQFTFDSIENYVDTGDFVMDKAEDGHEYIILWFTIRNTTNEDYHVNMFYEDSYLDGFAIKSEAMLFNIKGDTVWGDVAAGKARNGYVAFQVPEIWNEVEFQYKPIFSGQESKLIFMAYKSDIQD